MRKESTTSNRPLEDQDPPIIILQSPSTETERTVQLPSTDPVQGAPVQRNPVPVINRNSQLEKTEQAEEPNKDLLNRIPEIRRKGSLGVATNSKPYDIMKDLDGLMPTISLK